MKCSRLRDTILLELPKTQIPTQLLDANNQFTQLRFSADGRLVFCGRVVVHLNASLDECLDFGVISKNNKDTCFEFMTLKEEANVKKLMSLVHKRTLPKNIVHFDNLQPPIFSRVMFKNFVYFIHKHGLENGVHKKTSVIRMNTHTLFCYEIHSTSSYVKQLSLGPLIKEEEVVFVVRNPEPIKRNAKDRSLPAHSIIGSLKSLLSSAYKIELSDFEKFQITAQDVKQQLDDPKTQKSSALYRNTVPLALVSQGKYTIDIEIIRTKLKEETKFKRSFLKSLVSKQEHDITEEES